MLSSLQIGLEYRKWGSILIGFPSTGASKVFIFDHTIRSPSSDQRSASTNKALRVPLRQVHVDQTTRLASTASSTIYPINEAKRLLKGRVQIINVWRPIKTVRKDPLGVVDAMSVSEGDLVTKQMFHPNGVWESWTVCPNGNHEWYYLREQTPEEVMLIKCFDSKVDGRARRTPHSAFVDPSTKDEDPRQSIEVRALVFHPDDVE